MNANSQLTTEENVRFVVERARLAARSLAAVSDKLRRDALNAAGDALLSRKGEIFAANDLDVKAAREGGLSSTLIARLKTSENSVAEMAMRVREVVALPDPIGKTTEATDLDKGLRLYKISCPIGLIAVVFESRPDVISQVASLTLRSGNAVIFKGGIEATRTNQVLTRIWCDTLAGFPEIPPHAINLLSTRDEVATLLSMDEVDLIIPRGSKEFVRYISSATRIPVLGHGEGLCHVYIDRAADLQKAYAIAFDSKVQYPSACNAMETLLVHKDVAASFVPEMITRLMAAGVEVRGCSRTVAMVSHLEVATATEDDWSTEYSDLVLSIRIVESETQAIEHIERYGSGHTESIVTEDHEVAKRFMDRVDAAGVYLNASTRFADGYRYGMGAELGISCGKLHARGPVGLQGLTSYKYQLFGDGHIVADYANGERKFNHRRL